MKYILPFLAFFLCYSCIPLRIAPTIERDKVMLAKKFKRHLPKRYAFIFEDNKEANEFYYYVDTKYQLYDQDVAFNVPFEINGKVCYFSFHEVEIPDKTLNLIPIISDGLLERKGHYPILEDAEFSREGNWYIALTVSDDKINDCLRPGHPARKKVLAYLRDLHTEYLNTSNYVDILFEK